MKSLRNLSRRFCWINYLALTGTRPLLPSPICTFITNGWDPVSGIKGDHRHDGFIVVEEKTIHSRGYGGQGAGRVPIRLSYLRIERFAQVFPRGFWV